MREIRCEWDLVTPPTEEPIDISLAKLHASIVQTDEDALIYTYIKAARQAAETHLNHALMTQTWAFHVECFTDVMWLPMAYPLQNNAAAVPSTAPVVQYYDGDGVLQTLSTSYYEVDTMAGPGRILRAPNQSWPSIQSDRTFPVRITYVCGYTSADLVPEMVKMGMLLYIAGCDGDRVGEADRRAAERCWDVAGRLDWRHPEWRC